MKPDIFCANPRLQFLNQEIEIKEAINRVLNSDSYILGTEVKNFEKEFAEYIGSSHAIGVNSGTDALILALKSLGIGPGDEVITPSHTAVATVSAIVAVGAVPIYVDIDYMSYTINPDHLNKLISIHTRAVIAVHLYGHPCDMDSLLRLTLEHNLFLIEDCAQAHGAKWHGKKVGTIGNVGCFSFYPTKNLGALGDGGAITTNNRSVAEKIEMLRQYGWDSNRQSQVTSGVSRLDEIQAAVLRVKLRNLDKSNQKRRDIAELYFSSLSALDLLLPTHSKNIEHVFHLFVIQTTDREKLMLHLKNLGIHPGIHYQTPVHLQPAYRNSMVLGDNKLSVTESISNKILSLPMYPELKENEIQRVINGIKSVR